MHAPPRSARLTALVLAAGLFVAYNANGREIGNYDTQPTKLAARIGAGRAR